MRVRGPRYVKFGKPHKKSGDSWLWAQLSDAELLIGNNPRNNNNTQRTGIKTKDACSSARLLRTIGPSPPGTRELKSQAL